MILIDKQKLQPYISVLKTLCILAAIGFPILLTFKDLYFHTWAEKKETIIYSIPMVFLFFMWLKFKLDEQHVFHHQLFITDSVAVGLSIARILGLFWHSGHVLFILYTFLTSKNKMYRILCIPFIILTISVKMYWGDILTPILGVIIALGLYTLRTHFEKKLIKS
jgi:hypothetical protein